MSYVNAPMQDLLIRIKNAYMARKTTVDGVVFSKFKENMLNILKEYHFIKDFEIVEEGNKKTIKITLNVVKDPINDIPEIKLYSKPSRPWYVGYKNLKIVAGGKGI
jgi:small subunit ribosomal protein S8